MRTLSQELTDRGFVQQFSGESLANIVDGERRAFYLGADPTADSLHVGNLAQYMLVRHLAQAGHAPILLFGGGTGLIGDPRDSSERPLADAAEVLMRTQKLAAQAQRFIGIDVRVVNNADWLAPLGFIDFLRDIGKHFTVNAMIKKEIVAKRLADESPLSYTEFAYALMQAYDFWHLYKTYGCTVQTGGSDQWGNIISGVELIRKKENTEAFAIATPLIVDKATGRKFGKSEGNAVWLDPEMTSPYAFYQFWLNVTDEDVEDRLKIFTLFSLEDIAGIMAEHAKNKAARVAQKALALAVTAFVHNPDIAKTTEKISDALFGDKKMSDLSSDEIALIAKEAPTCVVQKIETISDVLISAGLATSKRDARTLVESGAVSLDGAVIKDAGYVLSIATPTLLRKGKKHLVVLLP